MANDFDLNNVSYEASMQYVLSIYWHLIAIHWNSTADYSNNFLMLIALK